MTSFPPVSVVTGVAAPLIRDNVDTDAIIPSREIKSVGKTGLADGLFAGWRYTMIGGREPDPAFIYNMPGYAHAPILLGGDNFGCGSSREHAVWALLEYGVQVVIASGFAPIFHSNCVRNGILPVVLDRTSIARLAELDKTVTVDLGAQEVTAAGESWQFITEPAARLMLLEGLDAIDLTLEHADTITRWQARDRVARSWIYSGALA